MLLPASIPETCLSPSTAGHGNDKHIQNLEVDHQKKSRASETGLGLLVISFIQRYLVTGGFLQESQVAHLFKEGLLAGFLLFSVASLAKDGGFQDTCLGPCR